MSKPEPDEMAADAVVVVTRQDFASSTFGCEATLIIRKTQISEKP